jgi:hypothetical protein
MMTNFNEDSDTLRLNKVAVANLRKDCPTCNQCKIEMTPQEGKFGKFYFCRSKCKTQKGVSDKYWQSIRSI